MVHLRGRVDGGLLSSQVTLRGVVLEEQGKEASEEIKMKHKTQHLDINSSQITTVMDCVHVCSLRFVF